MYDLALFWNFRRVKPPEEHEETARVAIPVYNPVPRANTKNRPT